MNEREHQQVKQGYMQYKLGDRSEQIADVGLHFVLPVKAYGKHADLIKSITGGDFHLTGVYNLVLLYTQAEDAKRAGTVIYGQDLEGLNSSWGDMLDGIAAEPDKAKQLVIFKGAHSFFRNALSVESGVADPCASANFLLANERTKRQSIWRRLLSRKLK